VNFVIWMLIGALLGGAASAFTGIRDRPGITLNVVVGIAGVMLWGSLLSWLIGASSSDQGKLSLAIMLVSILGAAVVLAGVRLFDGAVRGRVHLHVSKVRGPT
jgi:uncharacterized membrane protein YeaQ/YmgE (transglycosylase-associated protein family)